MRPEYVTIARGQSLPSNSARYRRNLTDRSEDRKPKNDRATREYSSPGGFDAVARRRIFGMLVAETGRRYLAGGVHRGRQSDPTARDAYLDPDQLRATR